VPLLLSWLMDRLLPGAIRDVVVTALQFKIFSSAYSFVVINLIILQVCIYFATMACEACGKSA
jgi:hypothetical protein